MEIFAKNSECSLAASGSTPHCKLAVAAASGTRACTCSHFPVLGRAPEFAARTNDFAAAQKGARAGLSLRGREAKNRSVLLIWRSIYGSRYVCLASVKVSACCVKPLGNDISKTEKMPRVVSSFFPLQ